MSQPTAPGSVIDRRALLQSLNNPDISLDYVSHFSGHINLDRCVFEHTVDLYYVPDKLIILPNSLERYLEAIGDAQWDTLELLTTSILEDIQNEIVPRWVRIRITEKTSDFRVLREHSTSAEDAQPGWENDELVARLIS